MLASVDAAVKAANIRPGLLVVERHFGVLEFHSEAQAEVKHAGPALLKTLGMNVQDRVKPKILNSQIIHKVNPYHAQMVNEMRLGKEGWLYFPPKASWQLDQDQFVVRYITVNNGEMIF